MIFLIVYAVLWVLGQVLFCITAKKEELFKDYNWRKRRWEIKK